MLETLLNKLEALVNERGSAAVLREHLALLRERVGALERENADLRTQLQQAQLQAQESQSQARRFAQDNPHAWRCDACGSVDLRRTGSRPDPTFKALGIKQALMTCRVCQQVSAFTEDR
ncbi:MAG: hypothetical protein KGZ67_13005 [Hydrogenophaga sp.]|nr:hypothetical protein [Hydrogenophaga sp.]